MSTRPRRPCPLYFALQSLISKRQWYEIPIRALNVYFPRAPVLDRYRAGIVEAGFDDRLVWFGRVASGIHPHGAASGLREACFLNVTLLSVFSVRSALDRPQIPRRRLNFDSHANQQYCLAISRALAGILVGHKKGFSIECFLNAFLQYYTHPKSQQLRQAKRIPKRERQLYRLPNSGVSQTSLST